MNKKLTTLGYLCSFLLGVSGGMLVKPLDKETNIVDKEAHIEAIVKHEVFLSKLPNYDPFGLWLDGKSYEDWMAKDLNRNYKR